MSYSVFLKCPLGWDKQDRIIYNAELTLLTGVIGSPHFEFPGIKHEPNMTKPHDYDMILMLHA